VSPYVFLEAQLGAELDQAPAHDLYCVPPLVILETVPRLLVEDGAPVEHVVNVEIPLHLGPPRYRERPAETEIHLLDRIVVERVGRDQLDRDSLMARSSGLAGAGREVPAQRRPDFGIGRDVARRDREPGKILIDRAGLELPWQRIDHRELDLRRGHPRPADVTEPG